MICKKCGNMYNEKENVFCPMCGEYAANGNVQNEQEYYGQPSMSNMGMYGQPAMMIQGIQHQQYAGKFYPGLSKSDLFRFQWMSKYNTAIMVLSILMYVFQALILTSWAIALTEALRIKNYYGYNNDLIPYCVTGIILIVIMLLFSVLAHVKKSRVASGVVMVFYILNIICQAIFMWFYVVTVITLLFTLILFGLAVAVFVLDIVYNAKWNSYRNTGIIPVR